MVFTTMPRSMSRTPPVVRPPRSATPRRRSPDVGMTPPAHASALPASISPITASSRALTTVFESQMHLSHSDGVGTCGLCQQALPPGSTGVWTWPRRCGVRLHLECAVQLRLREIDPPCIQCRNPWPGPAADSQLYSACQREGIPFQNTWVPLPQRPESGICDGMPAPPERVVALCCERLTAFDTPVHPRQMEWSPNRIFEINALGRWENLFFVNLAFHFAAVR